MTQQIPPPQFSGSKRLLLVATVTVSIGLSIGLTVLPFVSSVINAQDAAPDQRLNVARLGADYTLARPYDLDQWIHLGSNLGQGYGLTEFSKDDPGSFQIVEMEPSA